MAEAFFKKKVRGHFTKFDSKIDVAVGRTDHTRLKGAWSLHLDMQRQKLTAARVYRSVSYMSHIRL